MNKLLENKIVILKKILALKVIDVPEDVILFIAQETKTDELAEALIHVAVYAIVVESPITLALAQKALNSPKYFVRIKNISKKVVTIDTSKQKNIHKGYGQHLN